jgi:hypothetical protein
MLDCTLNTSSVRNRAIINTQLPHACLLVRADPSSLDSPVLTLNKKVITKVYFRKVFGMCWSEARY